MADMQSVCLASACFEAQRPIKRRRGKFYALVTAVPAAVAVMSHKDAAAGFLRAPIADQEVILESRRQILASLAAAAAVSPAGGARAELRPAPPEGGCIGCLGVVDGLLARCVGDLKGCVSSQDDRPEVFEVPWQMPDLVRRTSASEQDMLAARAAELRAAVQEAGGKVVSDSRDKRYLRAEFLVDVPFLGKDADDVEWYFTPDDTIVQFRAERRGGGADFGENRRRLEGIRQRLGWDLLPVLRNRQRALFFVESPFDNFGPALYEALRPGQEPTPYEAEVLAR
eukprot:TRINITY_DN38022_c0_g1_i1.p1 TRINITY_DN38022_c0_g1~~TRINITY_DN38022_c0_g1_i1.p1  ORF type:complete len:284 (-),score=62.95 TRINITY_DN38022_c0_g1_i1:217-1068(-)